MSPLLSANDLIAQLKNPDPAVRGPALQNAASVGAPAVPPLAALIGDADFETARAARRALWNVVRHAGRPGAAKEAAAVAHELTHFLENQPACVRHEVLWMLSEIGGDDAIQPIAVLLSDPLFREDARCALTRLPGRKATAALRTALTSAPEDFKFALAESLRKRGDSVRGYLSRKLVPSHPTAVRPPSAG